MLLIKNLVKVKFLHDINIEYICLVIYMNENCLLNIEIIN